MASMQDISFENFKRYTRRTINNFLDFNIEIFLYNKQWEYNNSKIQLNLILTSKFLNSQNTNILRDIIDEYVNKYVLSDTEVNSKSFMAYYVDNRDKTCYFTQFSDETKIKTIFLKYKSNKIYYDPINYIPCVEVVIQKDAYLNIRICETSNIDTILPQSLFISKNNILYTVLFDILSELDLVLSGLFIIYENNHYICTPQTISYFNQLTLKKQDYYSINVWTKRK
tara:strand:+ start:1770 stop:2447 length:678 start_codon:yes stop_codon:yes gene_type:complete